MVSQVYHGTQYIDEVTVLDSQPSRASGTGALHRQREAFAACQGLPDGRAYVHQDANYNVIGLTDLTGRVLERYYYSPYGELEVAFDAHFFDYDDDGDVDGEDLAAATTGGECWSNYSGDCRRLDADSDRDIDADDYAAISSFIDELSGDQAIQRAPAPTRSQLGNPFAHQGLVFDAEIGSYQNRARQYNPRLKRFMQRDPLGFLPWTGVAYRDGMNLYQYVASDPLIWLDATGMSSCTDGCGCDDGSYEFCGCVRNCRRADCFTGLVDCLSPGTAVAAGAIECAAACAPSVFLPGWVLNNSPQ
jgi:RHS repeat-associated protein